MPATVTIEDIKQQIQGIPEVTAWSDLIDVFDRAGGAPHPDWQIPLITCKAAGGRTADALPGAASIACLQISIMLADDMLDNDPRGEHRRRGPGEAANLALAFQSTAFRLIEQAVISDSQRIAAVNTLAGAALATSFGQHLDNKSPPGESNYWQVVSAKSTPFYGAAYRLGAIFANAPRAIASGMDEFGVLIGEIIQIEDDLEDALATPANPDWQRRGNNLLIIYALDAEYEHKATFISLLPAIEEGDADALTRAQHILIESGAVSYGAYNLVQRYQQAWRILEQLGLPDPAPLRELLLDYGETLAKLLRLGGVEVDLATLKTGSLVTDLAGEE